MVVMEARVVDPTHLELAQPIATPAGAKVVVSLADPTRSDKDRDEWAAFSLAGLNSAYTDSEPEYSAQ